MFRVVLIGFIVLISCKKDSTKNKDLPEVTNSGKNTFGCYVDGKPFVARVHFTIGGTVALSGNFDEETNYLQMQGAKESEDGGVEIINVRVFVEDGLGTYSMYAINDEFTGYEKYSSLSCTYYYDQGNLGTVRITYLNTTKNIISGIFKMKLINPDCYVEEMIISEGRFDFAY